MPGLQASRTLGLAAGALLSPMLFPLFLARRGRPIHRSGVVHPARVVPPSGIAAGALADLAARLAGPALVRFSGSLHEGEARKDALGISIRLYCEPRPCSLYSKGDQDLLFITAPSLAWSRLHAGVEKTQRHDYLANTYWSASAYEVEGLGRVSLRLIPSGAGAEGADRAERLQHAVERGGARLRLEVVSPGSEQPLPVAELHLGPRLSPEMSEALRLRPGSSGRGLRPSGFLQGLRVGPYVASQLARRLRSH